MKLVISYQALPGRMSMLGKIFLRLIFVLCIILIG